MRFHPHRGATGDAARSLPICRMYAFFGSIHIPMYLREVDIDESRRAGMAHHIVLEGLGQPHIYVLLREEEILDILRDSL